MNHACRTVRGNSHGCSAKKAAAIIVDLFRHFISSNCISTASLGGDELLPAVDVVGRRREGRVVMMCSSRRAARLREVHVDEAARSAAGQL